MRTIKFRAWSKEKNEWLNPKDFAIAGNGLLIRYDQYPEDKNSPDGWTKTYNNEGYIIQQFTNLKSSQGIDMYEGDIVEWEDWDNGWGKEDEEIETGKGTIEWGHMAYGGYTEGWYIREHKNSYSIGLEKKKIKVIGNIIKK